MFCFKCGNKVNKDAAFCANCGAKIPENPECKIQTQFLSKVNHVTAGEGSDIFAGGDSSADSVELVVSVEKVEDQRLAKVKFPLFIDDIPIDELSNGQEETFLLMSYLVLRVLCWAWPGFSWQVL